MIDSISREIVLLWRGGEEGERKRDEIKPIGEPFTSERRPMVAGDGSRKSEQVSATLMSATMTSS